jgi:hypothetical protein
MPLVECDICGKYKTHHGPGPIEDHCTNGGPPGEHLTVYRHPTLPSRL